MKQLKNGHHDIKFVMNLQICKKKKPITVISELAMNVYQV